MLLCNSANSILANLHSFFCKIFLLIKNNEIFTDSDLKVTHILSCFTVNFSLIYIMSINQ